MLQKIFKNKKSNKVLDYSITQILNIVCLHSNYYAVLKKEKA